MSQAKQPNSPQFTQPVNQIFVMLVISALVGVGAYFSYNSVSPIFLASPYLNGFILAVFAFGVLACFWQVLAMVSSVSWIESFAEDRPGNEFSQAPGLLSSLATLLRKRSARHALTATSTRSILDTVASRLDEARDVTRYIINLLIFLGLLGTFYGLATTVPAVVDTIRSLAPQQDGEGSMGVFDNLMGGLEKQLGGMGTAFGSSLLGLAGSLVVGLLDLFTGHAQNRFYRELEEWLSSITKLGTAQDNVDVSSDDSTQPNNSLDAVLQRTTEQLENLQKVALNAQERRLEADARIERLAGALEDLIQLSVENSNEESNALNRVASGQQEIVTAMQITRDETTGLLDPESRMRLRNIDEKMLQLVDKPGQEMSELKSELVALTAALRTATNPQDKS